MEPIISKLQEGVKYPRFERDATTIINDLVEHITKERGVYSSSIEPNPSEHKVWFNTNNNTLNIYENGRWNTINGQGGGGSSSSGAIINNATINTSTINGGTISGATISGGTLEGSINATSCVISGATISGGIINGPLISGCHIDDAYINTTGGQLNNTYFTNGFISGNITITGVLNGGTISGATISGGTIKGAIINGGGINNADMTNPTIKSATISGGNINGVTLENINISSGTISEGGTLNYGSLILLTYAGTVTNPVLIPNGGIIGNSNKTVNVAGVSIVGSAINNATINGGKFAGNMDISTGGNITYANNKVLLAYTGSVGNPIIMPNGGDIGNSTSKFNICGVALTGGDFQKLKNLQ